MPALNRVGRQPSSNKNSNNNGTSRSTRDIDHGLLLNEARFIRLGPHTSLNDLETFLRVDWQMPKPKLIVSIIGGAKYFSLTDRLESTWINGIIKVVSESDVWMLTTGYNNGVVQLVGEAIKKFKLREPKKRIIAIGICQWDCITDVKTLTRLEPLPSSQPDTEKKPRNNKQFDTTVVGQQNKVKVETSELESNHSHYIILDDKNRSSYDTEDFRTKLCSRMTNVDRHDNFDTSTVTVVIEGGLRTIAAIYYDCEANIPVVIVDGSGRAADLFSRWLLCAKEFDDAFELAKRRIGINEYDQVRPVVTQEKEKSFGRTHIHADIHLNAEITSLGHIFRKYTKQLERDIRNTFNRDDRWRDNGDDKDNEDAFERNIKQTLEYMMFCLQPAVRSNITIFSIDSEDDLQECIFGSICSSFNKLRGQKKDEQSQGLMSDSSNQTINTSLPRNPLLLLAMDWNCIHAAKNFVLENSLDGIWNEDEAFKDALTRNLPLFVNEFIKLGINPVEILFPDNTFFEDCPQYDGFLTLLYRKEIIETSKSCLNDFISDEPHLTNKQITTVDALNIILRILVGDYMHNLYFNSYAEDCADRIESGLIRDPNRSENIAEDEHREEEEDKKQIVSDHLMRDLFLWAVLMNFIDMAKVCLAHMKYRICPALIASTILKKYHRKAPYGEVKDAYLESAKYFETYAINCLALCVENNPEQACEIILQRNELYGYVTCVEIAANADDKKFIATPCCVAAMNNVIYDKIDSNQRKKRDRVALVIGFISLGILAPAFVTYREKQPNRTGSEEETSEAVLEPFGIHYGDPYALENPSFYKKLPAINRYFHRVKNFHQSLLTKFACHVISYVCFLLLFSYVLLFNFSPPTNQIPSIHWTEILTIVWVTCSLIEEVHYFLRQDKLTLTGRLENYFRDPFKPMTVLAIVLFYIGLIVRFTYADSEVDFTAARVIMALDVELWWLRFLAFIIVVPFLGPQIIAIQKMLKSLLFFLCIIGVAITGYGVASRSLVYYPVVNNFTTETGGSIDTSFDGRSVFRQIIYPVYYLLHNDFGNELTNLNDYPNAGWAISTQVLLAIHMMFVNILLTNLLIAIFSRKFDQVYEDTQDIWYFQQYLFTREYYTRTPLFPPLNVVFDIYYLGRIAFFIIRRKLLKKPGDRTMPVFKIIAKTKALKDKWAEFEGASTYEYAHNEVKMASKKPSNKTVSHSMKKGKNSSVKKHEESESKYEQLKQMKAHLNFLDKSISQMKKSFDEHFRLST